MIIHTSSPSIIIQGGMFEYVSGANFFGEILEWTGFAIAAWTLPVSTKHCGFSPLHPLFKYMLMFSFF